MQKRIDLANQTFGRLTVMVDCKIDPTLFGQKRSASLKMVFASRVF